MKNETKRNLSQSLPKGLDIQTLDMVCIINFYSDKYCKRVMGNLQNV